MTRALGIIGAVLTILFSSLLAEAQDPAKTARVGVLWPAPGRGLEVFLQGLRDLGYVDGQNVILEYRWTGLDLHRPEVIELAADLVRRKPDVIVAVEVAGGQAAQQATRTIPIVVVTCDPFELLVSSLARPGGNVTGQTCMSSELTPKKLQLFKEAVPRLSRVAFLYNPNEPGPTLGLKLAQAAPSSLHITVQPIEVRGEGDLDAAFEAISRARFDGLFVYPDFVTARGRPQILAFAAKQGLPAMYGFREWVDSGGLMSYGTSNAAMIRRAATYVGKILKGAKPADLPVEQPTKFELVINLKTAKALGLTIPQSVLMRADEVIQ